MLFLVAILVGFGFSFLFPGNNLHQLPYFGLLLYAMLAIGLYGAVHGIELVEFHKHRLLILRAVTFGVLLKSLIIGSILWFLFHTPFAFLFAIIVSQIDPLSVSHLLKGKDDLFSHGARTILRAWSSFDDPMTVLLALYLYLPLVVNGGDFTLQRYVLQLGANLLFTCVLYLLTKLFKDHRSHLLLLLIAFVIAIPYQLMLGIALTGLFLRPKLPYLPRIVTITFYSAALLLGTLLTITSTNILIGVTLGFVAFVAQICVTPLVAPRLNMVDKLFLAFAQYNGITSVILALLISEWVSQTVDIIAFAIITINLLYYGSNHLLNRFLKKQG